MTTKQIEDLRNEELDDQFTFRIGSKLKSQVKKKIGKAPLAGHVIDLLINDLAGAQYQSPKANNKDGLLSIVETFHPTALDTIKEWAESNNINQPRIIFYMLDELLAKIETDSLDPTFEKATLKKK